MKNKLISLVIALTFLCSNFIFVSAITPSAKIELNSYSYTINSLQDVKISGTISKAYGQKLIVKNSNNTPILLNDLPNANGSASAFEFTIKSSRITEGTNTFQVQSSNLMGKVSASNPKTITITYKKQSKKNQVITASNKSVQVGKTVSLGASVNSGLQLFYMSSNVKIAVVDSKGNITGKKEGTVTLTISNKGSTEYNEVKKEVKVTVTKAAAVVKKNQTITASNKSVKVGKSISLGAKVSSGLKPTYKSSNTKVVTVDSNGKVIGKKAGKATITITQNGNSKWNKISKNITITVIDNNKTFTVVYYGNGTTYNNKKYEIQKLKTGTTTTIWRTYFTRKGYTFMGWSTKVNGKVIYKSGIKLSTDTLYKNKDKNNYVKLYAVWNKNPDTYTIEFHPEGGTGKVYKQTAKVDTYTKLTANKFKRDGYVFVGWATESTRANKHNSTNIEKFENINMDEFQLGQVAITRKPSAKGIKWEKLKDNQKQHLLNGVNVVSLAAPNKTVKLYAVWKGCGPQAAVDWAKIIAADNNFAYGKGNRAHQHGCPFCGTNVSKKNTYKSSEWNKTYCCNPFIKAAYEHGANHSYVGGNMSYSSWLDYDDSHGYFKKVSRNKSNLQPGDVMMSAGHVWMYVGDGQIVDAGREGWGSDTIAVRNTLYWGSCERIVRYVPTYGGSTYAFNNRQYNKSFFN